MPGIIDKEPARRLAGGGMPRALGEMAALYEHARAELAPGAHITKLLHVFATRSVRKSLSGAFSTRGYSPSEGP